jgi:hypothetical protein
MYQSVLIKEHALEDLVRQALAEAELLYPGEELSVEVELNETLTLVIKVFRKTALATTIH